MSLPFADEPADSSIYQDLKVKKLVDLTANDFDAFRARMDAQGVEGLEDEYRRLLLLGLVSNKLSTSGPIPNTGFVTDLTVSGSNDGTYTLLQPNKGEVWQFDGGSATSTGSGVAIRYRIQIYDLSSGAFAEIADESITSNQFIFDPSVFPVTIDENVRIQVSISGTDATTTASVNICGYRIR